MLEIEKTVLAHRYLYYCLSKPVISDYEYDKLEKEALKVVAEDSVIRECGSDLEDSYSDEVKNLAKLYLKK